MQFGVFVDQNEMLFQDNGDLNDDGILDSDAGLDAPLRRPVRTLEDTGLNRMLGGTVLDSLYGGTGLDFMEGNPNVDSSLTGDAAKDKLFNRRGEQLVGLDGGVAGDEWKEYAKSTNKVWYYGGSNKADQISVDFVTEPGSVLTGIISSRD